MWACTKSLLKPGLAACLGVAMAACATHPPSVEPPRESRPAAPTPAQPPATRGEFTIQAYMLDAWNAVGQIVVRTPGVVYLGRAQMLGLYSIRYRDRPLLILTRSLPLSDTIRETTTLVTAASAEGKPIDSDVAAELLAVLQRDLPLEVERVRAKQAEEKRAMPRRR